MQFRIEKRQSLTRPCDYIIIDTDVGGDDAQALLYAINQAKITKQTIVGITCINGNTFLKQVAKNVIIVQALCGSSIPVYLGCQTSLLGGIQKDYYFNQDGLGGKQSKYWKQCQQNKTLNQKLISKDLNAMEFIVKAAEQYKGNIGIIALGPLSNLAVAYHLDNSIVDKINVVSLMGGSITGMGIRHFFASEFNFFLDAHAAKIVINSYKNVIIIAFDFVLQLQPNLTRPLFQSVDTQKGKFINDIYQNILNTDAAALCDPIAVVPIMNPQLVHGYYEVAAEVQTAGERTSGCIVFDWLSTTNNPRKVKLISVLDLENVCKHIKDSYN